MIHDGRPDAKKAYAGLIHSLKDIKSHERPGATDIVFKKTKPAQKADFAETQNWNNAEFC